MEGGGVGQAVRTVVVSKYTGGALRPFVWWFVAVRRQMGGLLLVLLCVALRCRAVLGLCHPWLCFGFGFGLTLAWLRLGFGLVLAWSWLGLALLFICGAVRCFGLLWFGLAWLGFALRCLALRLRCFALLLLCLCSAVLLLCLSSACICSALRSSFALLLLCLLALLPTVPCALLLLVRTIANLLILF